MAIDFSKPATTDNYSTAFVPNIQGNQTALAQLLDSSLVTITGTPPTGAKRYNRTSSALEEWNGSAWAPIMFHGLTFNGGNVGVGAGVVAASKLQIGTGSTSEKIVVKGLAADAEFGNDATGVRLGTPNNAPVVVVTSAVERGRFPGAGGFWLGRSTDSAFGLLQVLDTTGSIADLASSAAGTSIARLRNTGAQITGLAVQNSATGTTSASGVRLLVDASGVGYLNQEGANSLNFSTNGSTRLSIASGGLVTASVGLAGPGSGITGLNADNLASGTVPNARTTGTAAATANTLALRDANGDTAVRAITIGNVEVAGASVLDWYNEVTPTPGLTFGGVSTGWTWSTILAKATRVGNRVDFVIQMSVTAVGAANGVAAVTGLPWTVGGTQHVSVHCQNLVSVAHERLFAQAVNTTTRVDISDFASAIGVGATLTHANFQVGSSVRVFGTYFA